MQENKSHESMQIKFLLIAFVCKIEKLRLVDWNSNYEKYLYKLRRVGGGEGGGDKERCPIL